MKIWKRAIHKHFSTSKTLLATSIIAASLSMISGCSEQVSDQVEPGVAKSAAEKGADKNGTAEVKPSAAPEIRSLIDDNRYSIYAPVELKTDLSHLSSNQKKMLEKLIDAASIMDDLFWKQSFGVPKQDFLSQLPGTDQQEFARVNYGPWDRLNDNKPFLSGYDEKPLGAGFYPADMTREEFEAWEEPNKRGLYSNVVRDSQGQLSLVPYSTLYQTELTKASALLDEAATLAEDKDFAHYLQLRAKALLSDDYQASDLAWMDMKNNPVDVVIGPIENYEDKLFNYRAAFEGYVLIKDMDWSKKLARFAGFLPQLQEGLPVDSRYKQEKPGTDSDLNAYDVIYYAGDCNAGSKTIAINLPNDEEVQLAKGTRRLQLKNAMKAKFDQILLPIANELIVEDQRKNITFDAFFSNTMFHEVAHGLGIKKTLTTGEPVRKALKEVSSAVEEGKADILGLYMVTELFNQGELKQGTLMDNYVTFMAGIFRSVRFGAASAHGKANMVRFNFFEKAGAFSRNEKTGQYRIDFDKMQQAMEDLSRLILTIQGDGNYRGAKLLLDEQGLISDTLQKDLDRLTKANIPVDVKFIQGKQVLALNNTSN